MKESKYKAIVRELLDFAGIDVDGKQQLDIQVHDDRMYKRAITEVELGLGESYMAGWWMQEK